MSESCKDLESSYQQWASDLTCVRVKRGSKWNCIIRTCYFNTTRMKLNGVLRLKLMGVSSRCFCTFDLLSWSKLPCPTHFLGTFCWCNLKKTKIMKLVIIKAVADMYLLRSFSARLPSSPGLLLFLVSNISDVPSCSLKKKKKRPSGSTHRNIRSWQEPSSH